MARRTHARFHRTSILTLTAALVVLVPAGSAFACGGLVTANGTMSLTRTTTLAAYHDGIEHYVTVVRVRREPTRRGRLDRPAARHPDEGDQGRRLDLATAWSWRRSPPATGRARRLGRRPVRAVVILKTKIDSLDITVLKGGAVDVGTWATHHGFFLPPDAPEVLAFYAERSPIFMAVQFDVEPRHDQGCCREGTPVHVVIPTPNPWVPLRILTLGRTHPAGAGRRLPVDRPRTRDASARGAAERRPRSARDRAAGERGRIAQLARRSPLGPQDGLAAARAACGSRDLKIDTPASTLTNDLAVDASGFGHPSSVAAGTRPVRSSPARRNPVGGTWVTLGVVVVIAGADCSPASGRTGRRDLMRRARMQAARVRGAPRLPLLAGAGAATAAGWLGSDTPPDADAHRAHHDPLLRIRSERHRDPARPDDPLRGREHRPDRPRVHRGR